MKNSPEIDRQFEQPNIEGLCLTVGVLTTAHLGRRIIVSGADGRLNQIRHEVGMFGGENQTWLGIDGGSGWRYFAKHPSTDIARLL